MVREQNRPPASPSRNRLRHFIKNCALSAIVFAIYLFLLVGLGELSLRIFERPNHLMPDPILNHVRTPNFVRDMNGCNQLTNSQGFLEAHDIEQSRAENSFRVFYLGDSFTEGTCHASIPRIVEERLSPAFARHGVRLEVVNAACASYSPELYRLLLKSRILQFKPDLVVINIDMTDLFDDWLARGVAVRGPDGEPTAFPYNQSLSKNFVRTEEGLIPRHPFAAWLSSVAAESHLRRAVTDILDRMVTHSDTKGSRSNWKAFDWCREPWSEQVVSEVNKTKETIASIVRLVKDSGARLALTGVPHLDQFRHEWSDRPFRFLKETSDQFGTPFGDMLEKLEPYFSSRPDEFYIPNDMHMNDRGLTLLALSHLEFLCDPTNNLLPEVILDEDCSRIRATTESDLTEFSRRK